jgi:hypothetical protein
MASKSENRRLGVQVEKFRADKRGGEHVGTDGWFDVEGRDGTPVEVKSCSVRVETDTNEWTETRTGRYQLERDNHRNLADHDGEYDFVLRDDDNGEPVDTVTMSAGEVDDLINELDRKWPSGSKLKIQWTDIHGEDP